MWTLDTILFSLLSGLMMISGLAVISERNPVHSVFFLVLTFCQGSCLLLLVGAEFMAMLFLIVYVGAIAVLFLFVVMMLTTQTEASAKTWVPLLTGVSMVLFVQLAGLVPGWPTASHVVPGVSDYDVAIQTWSKDFYSYSNVEALGTYIYTTGASYFMMAGLLLWVAMVGAIVLTLHRREYMKKQAISEQVARTAESAIILKTWS